MSFGISFCIETLQLLFKRGFAEFDDVFHNVLGCLLGYGIIVLIKHFYESISKRRVTTILFCLAVPLALVERSLIR